MRYGIVRYADRQSILAALKNQKIGTNFAKLFVEKETNNILILLPTGQYIDFHSLLAGQIRVTNLKEGLVESAYLTFNAQTKHAEVTLEDGTKLTIRNKLKIIRKGEEVYEFVTLDYIEDENEIVVRYDDGKRIKWFESKTEALNKLLSQYSASSESSALNAAKALEALLENKELVERAVQHTKESITATAQAKQIAEDAASSAANAEQSARNAQESAQSFKELAQTATEGFAQAVADAQGKAENAESAATSAENSASRAESAVAKLEGLATGASNAAISASEAANKAETQAKNASTAATSATNAAIKAEGLATSASDAATRAVTLSSQSAQAAQDALSSSKNAEGSASAANVSAQKVQQEYAALQEKYNQLLATLANSGNDFTSFNKRIYCIYQKVNVPYTNSTHLEAGTIFFIPFRTLRKIRVAEVHFFIISAGSLLSSLNFAVYKNKPNAEAPDTVVYQSAEISASVTGIKTLATDFILDAGVYYFAYQTNSTSKITLRGISQYGTDSFLGTINASSTEVITRFTKTALYSKVLPATPDNVVAVAGSGFTPPVFWFKESNL